VSDITNRPGSPPQPLTRAQRRRDQTIRAAVRKLRARCPHLDKPEYMPLIRSYARLSVLIERAYAVLRDGNIVDDKGELRQSLDTLRRMMSTQAALAEKLGLSPHVAASMAKPVTPILDLDSIRSATDGDTKPA
jgi:hypothetical protein